MTHNGYEIMLHAARATSVCPTEMADRLTDRQAGRRMTERFPDDRFNQGVISQHIALVLESSDSCDVA